MLAHIADVMDPEYWFAKHCIKFIKMALNSENKTVNTISNMGRYGTHSIMGANFKHFNCKYEMSERNVNVVWNDICDRNEDVIRICVQVKELVYMREKCTNGVLSRGECSEIIEILCTE